MRIFLPRVKQKSGEALEYRFQGRIKDYFDEAADEKSSFFLAVKVRSSGDKIIVAGKLQADTDVACCRCLRPFRQKLDSDFEELFTMAPLQDKKLSPEELALETANELTVSGDYLYLKEFVRQLYFLSQVYNPLCKPDCRGLCAGCGVDLNKGACSCEGEANIDLRLQKLKDFYPGDRA